MAFFLMCSIAPRSYSLRLHRSVNLSLRIAYFLVPISCWAIGDKVVLPEVIQCNGVEMQDARLVGAGGGGYVFAARGSRRLPSYAAFDDLIFKVSLSGSAKSVLNECETLRQLESSSVENVEQCLASCSFELDNERRAAVVLRPYFTASDGGNVVSTIDNLTNENVIRIASNSLLRTAAQIVVSGRALSDVQLLIDDSSGTTLLIDMTEAVAVNKNNPTFFDEVLVRSFIQECLSLVPRSAEAEATRAFQIEVNSLMGRNEASPAYKRLLLSLFE